MSQWMGRNAQKKAVELAVLQESALAMAQATIQNAIDESGIKRSELAEKMGRPRSDISRMLSGSHGLTIKTFALALAACGRELRFVSLPIQWGWVQEEPLDHRCEVVPTEGGQFYGNPRPTSVVIELPYTLLPA